MASWFRRGAVALGRYFSDNEPTFANAFAPMLFVVALLYVRSPTTNCIFDEQEALLANPYVNGRGLRYWDAFHRDFWGLPHTRSIGSYRPFPNLVWRLLWPLGNSPWLLHWVNVVIHAACAALLGSFVFSVTKQRRLGWWSAFVYAVLALLTEAVTGVVGLADMLGALFLLLALHALAFRWFWAFIAIFVMVLCGLFSKESELVALPLLAAAAVFVSRPLHARRTWALARALVALVAAAVALVVYTEIRRRLFPVEASAALLRPMDADQPWAMRKLNLFLN
jgi:hypothetical protein